MTDNDPLKKAKEGISLVKEIIDIAGESPEVKEAAGNLGKTAVVVTKTINNALLPLAAVNFAFDKAREYFSGKFQKDISEKTLKIPEDQIIEPKASIAGPTLQALAFTHEEVNLKEMYLNLLATSMDQRVANKAHPAFVEIIKQLNSDEASLVKGFLDTESMLPIIQITLKIKISGGKRILSNHIVNLIDVKTETPIEEPNFPAMVDNWIRLGLIEVDYDKHISNNDRYSWSNERPEYLKAIKEYENSEDNVTIQKGIIIRTAFGCQFAESIGLI